MDPQTKPEPAERLFLSIQEVSVLLNISTRTIWRLVSLGEGFPRPVAIGTVARWRRADVVAFAESVPDARLPLRFKPDPRRQRDEPNSPPAKRNRSGRPGRTPAA
ncbi:MAG: helix-turn-helix transcriptional regulator [Thermoguttaceae bacterium]